MTVSTSSSMSSNPGRLNGWKEIAAYFGKGVRTVQRWEKDLGLPVRRLSTGRGEVVFAVVSELEAWEAAATAKRDDLTARPGEDEGASEAAASGAAPASQAPAVVTGPPFTGAFPQGGAGRRRRGRFGMPARIAILALIVIAVAAAGFVAWRSLRAGQPYQARVEDHALRVYDERGRFLWEHRFEFPLLQTPEVAAVRASRPSTFVEDLDGDGSREVVFATNCEPMSVAHGVYVFSAAGDLRFRHRVRALARYGDIPSTGPWRPVMLAVVPDDGGRRAIWVSSSDRDQFATVVEKVDADNRVLGEFWHPGNIEQLVPSTYAGRPVMLAGGSSNEFNGAALAVLDRARPTGTAPAVLPKFTCHGCPAGLPLEYLVFPGTELERLQDNTCGVEWIQRGERGHITIAMKHVLYLGKFGKGDGAVPGRTHVTLDAGLKPLSAEHQPDFRVMHDEAYRRGVLDHPFGRDDEAALWPILRWTGSAFEKLRPGVTS